MPTKRTRRPRPSKLTAEAEAWVASADAADFFERPTGYPLYSGAISKLPGVLPWWNPLVWLWRRHTTGVEITPGPQDALALEFVLALHRDYARHKGASHE